MNRILIIQTAFIGDVILATPVAEKLHRFYPEASIDFLVRKGNEGLLRDHPFIGETLVFDKKQKKLRNLLKLAFKVRKKKYDLIVNLHRFASSGFIVFLSGAKVKLGFDKNPFSFCYSRKTPHEIGTGKHETRRNIDVISYLTDSYTVAPKLYPSPDDEAMAEGLRSKGPYVCMAPTSVWFTKQWPREKWVELIRTLPEGYVIYLLGAPGDLEACEWIRREAAQVNVHNLCGKLDFLQSAALMRGAVMNYVNDSAPMHLCSAVNAATAAIFCSTVPAFGFGPLSDISHIIEITEPLSCRPCGLHGYKECPEAHFRCALDIDVQRLARLVPG